MSKLSTAAKRLVLGRPFRSDTLGHELLPKRTALPVFASDALSSVAYAPEEIFLVLSVAGLSAYAFSPWIGLAVAFVLVIVVAGYRQTVRAYPSGGGDYEVATKNLGPTAGLTVGSALLVDYVLTVAVSLSSAAATVGSAVPFVARHKVLFVVVAIVLLTAVNLRGLRRAGRAFAVLTYTFVGCMLVMLGAGMFRIFVLGDDLRAESADFELVAEQTDLTALAFVLLLARAFSSGCAALTGVEAISTGVPAFKKPKARNAATTLLVLGGIAVTLFLGVVFLAERLGVVVAEHPDTQLRGAPEGYEQKTLLSQLAHTVFEGVPAAFVLITIVTAVILVLAANTAFNGFPVLGSVLAQNRYLPRQFHTRGDRLAFSNGILFLAGIAVVFVWVFEAEVTRLIQLYIVGVFVAFSLGQAGMVRHWTRELSTETDPSALGRMARSRLINGVGCVSTSVVLLVVLTGKFAAGAWIAVVTMVVAFGLMKAIRHHYDTVAAELERADWDGVLPSRTHSIVLVSTLHLPTMRALAYARATRSDTLEAITVNVDDESTRRLVLEWEKSDLTVPLKVVESPYREITRPVLDYVRRVRRDSPRDVVTVFIPEYVVGHWWEQLLHNQSALRLKSRLLFQPGVMVTSVPWQLRSSADAGAVGRAAPNGQDRQLDNEEEPR
ncbi:APC family permease [Rhodococcus sp. Chr-9]|uniref:APC family permease n=1 Tax=Rhodococcus sp. Chr-9 TaxID=713612 RepID=UPI000573D207|nr:APC family permease [Rhodococcus sp. Chr-9]KHJ70819.1 DNA-binding protein [Rhodococcus sp. Chr-9]